VHVADAERLQHVGLDVFLVGEPGAGLDDLAEHLEADVRVRVAGARREVQARLEEVADHRLLRDRVRLFERLADVQRNLGGIAAGEEPRVRRRGIGKAVDAPIPSRGVLEEVAYQDGIDLRVGDVGLGQIRVAIEHAAAAEDRFVEVEPAVLDQRHDGDGRDRLGHAGDTEQVVRLGGLRPGEIGAAEGTQVDQPTVLGHGHGQARYAVGGHEVGGQRVADRHLGDVDPVL
jgi:hypothetical protein